MSPATWSAWFAPRCKLTKATVIQAARRAWRAAAPSSPLDRCSPTLTTLLLLLGAVARLSEQMKVWQAALLVAGGTAVLAALVIGIGVAALRGHTRPIIRHLTGDRYDKRCRTEPAGGRRTSAT